MADTTVEQAKSGGGEYSWALAGAAVVAVLGLMVWLYSTRDLIQDPAMDMAEAPAEVVETTPVTELSAIGMAPDQFVGQEVRVAGVPIAAVLGDRGFWAEIPGQNPFLMVVDPTVPDVSWLAAGETVGFEGTVQAVTEEGVNAWVEQELIRPGASAEASFATHYLAISQATP